ncbi:hypothetical protein SNE40_015596 [Patella caerulea]|uniref:Uncharacterized protein n=1 Tax=Patella caerulea TaxID=87958 RepID=A0AAN8PS89_PATCE
MNSRGRGGQSEKMWAVREEANSQGKGEQSGKKNTAIKEVNSQRRNEQPRKKWTAGGCGEQLQRRNEQQKM